MVYLGYTHLTVSQLKDSPDFSLESANFSKNKWVFSISSVQLDKQCHDGSTCVHGHRTDVSSFALIMVLQHFLVLSSVILQFTLLFDSLLSSKCTLWLSTRIYHSMYKNKNSVICQTLPIILNVSFNRSCQQREEW